MLKRRFVFQSAVVSLAFLSLVGCGSKGNRSASQPGNMPMANQKFDLVDEPPITGETRLAAGQLAESRNDWPMAIKQYEGAIKDTPNDIRLISRLATAYTMTQQFAKAESMWLQLVQATNGNADAWNNLAQCYEYANRSADAENAYLSAIKSDPNNKYARTNFGLMLVRSGRLDEGRDQLLAALPPSEAHYNVASVLEMLGNKTMAKQEYLQALQADPNMYDARKRLAAMEQQ